MTATPIYRLPNEERAAIFDALRDELVEVTYCPVRMTDGVNHTIRATVVDVAEDLTGGRPTIVVLRTAGGRHRVLSTAIAVSVEVIR